jgi:hypothetical protein
MTIISSKEFISNQKRYFDLAIDEKLFIRRGKNMFHLMCTTAGNNANDNDYLTKDDLLAGIHKDIDTFYASK